MRRILIAVGFVFLASPAILIAISATSSSTNRAAELVTMSCPLSQQEFAYRPDLTPRGTYTDEASLAVYAVNLSNFDIWPANGSDDGTHWQAQFMADLTEDSWLVVVDAWTKENYESAQAFITVSKCSTAACGPCCGNVESGQNRKTLPDAEKLRIHQRKIEKNAIQIQGKLASKGRVLGYLQKKAGDRAAIQAASNGAVATTTGGEFSLEVPTKTKGGLELNGEFWLVLRSLDGKEVARETIVLGK